MGDILHRGRQGQFPLIEPFDSQTGMGMLIR